MLSEVVKKMLENIGNEKFCRKIRVNFIKKK
jgi:hypothetical protein